MLPMKKDGLLRLYQRWLLLLALVFIAGCSDTKSMSPEEEAPEIPPSSTMLMDFASFDTTFALPKTALPGVQQQDANWRWASFKVGVWNVLITVNMAIPVAAFLESFKYQPVQQDDGSWLWAYNFGIGNSAKLFGKVADGNVYWQMLITRPNQYTDFEWFTGVSNLPATEGTWRLNAAPNNPTPYIDIEWHRNVQQNTADIRYTNVIPGHPGNGGYILYGTTGSTGLDAFYTIFNTENGNLTNIEWSRSDFHGRIKDPLRYQDGDWHCWDTLDNGLVDVTCP